MTIQIICPQCQAGYTISEEQEGKRVKCKECETVFTATPPARPRRPEREEDEEYRPRRSRRQAGGISTLGLVLVIGGVLGSLILVAGLGVVVVWVWTQPRSAPSSQPNLANADQGAVVDRVANRDQDEEPAADAAPKAGEVKHVEPPPPPPRELVFLPPAPQEALNAPKAPANIELAQEVLDRVKKATVHLRVVMGNGQMGQGSGFFALAPNIILTNAHVVGMLQPDHAPPRTIEVEQNGGTKEERKYPAELLGVDRQVDLAVLRAQAPTLPPPLEVRSAKNLRETQRIWVVGFPLGDQLGKEVSVTDGTVSSIRQDANGVLSKIQVKGDMQPGNSGGPVIDALGNVVGVAVAILRGTQINFAVPGDWVNALGTGRLSRLTIGQPYVKDGNLKLPITMHVIDPLRRVHASAIECWTGKASPATRLPSLSAPAMEPGDTPHERQPLQYKDGIARQDIALPPLPPGQAYWIQPAWGTSSGSLRWASAQVCELPTPVELKPVVLTLKHQAGSRNAHLNKWLTMKLNDHQRGEYSVLESEECKLTETVQTVDAAVAQANLALQYRSYNVDLKVENMSQPRTARAQKILDDVKNLTAFLSVDKEGNPIGRDLDLTKTAKEYYTELATLHGEIEQTLEGLMIPFPNKSVSPGTAWQAERILPLLPQGSRSHDTTLAMSYTYLGSRKRNQHEEAVIGIQGRVSGGRGKADKSGVEAEGTAVIDLTNGQVSETDLFLTFDTEVKQYPPQAIKANGTLRLRLRRAPTSANGAK